MTLTRSILSFLVMTVAMTASVAKAHPNSKDLQQVEVLSNLSLLRHLNIPVLAKNEKIGVGYAVLTPEMQMRLSQLNHAMGRCGGFEVLPPIRGASIEARFQELHQLSAVVERDIRRGSQFVTQVRVDRKPEIDAALAQLKEENLRDFVTWASNFPNRYNRAPDPNVAVRALAQKVQGLAVSLRREQQIQVELIDHKSTKQQSLRVRIPGAVRPQEVVVLGAHFDSINQMGGAAPGADDNASGSSNIAEILRVLLLQSTPPARTVEFYWYAGEESGLLGSAEIAKAAKEQNRQIMAVLQLDMTLFPGSGEFVIGNMTDYTSPWLRDFLKAINATYLNARLVEDQCGYGCSDHASWYRQGFPTLMPFEATMNSMNRQIHTARDIVSNTSNFRHSHMFSKLGLIFAMELANSVQQQPF